MKFKFLWVFLVLVLLCAPATAFAASGFDDYGYNEKARLFIGTFDNWEAFIYGQPALPAVNPSATDVLFVERYWNQSFDNTMFHGKDPVDGAYCASNFHMNLSGDQLGWVWHEFFIFTYASRPIDGALAIPDMPGFYMITDRVWLTDQNGNETEISNMQATFLEKYKGRINTAKSLLHKQFTFKGHVKVGLLKHILQIFQNFFR